MDVKRFPKWEALGQIEWLQHRLEEKFSCSMARPLLRLIDKGTVYMMLKMYRSILCQAVVKSCTVCRLYALHVVAAQRQATFEFKTHAHWRTHTPARPHTHCVSLTISCVALSLCNISWLIDNIFAKIGTNPLFSRQQMEFKVIVLSSRRGNWLCTPVKHAALKRWLCKH